MLYRAAAGAAMASSTWVSSRGSTRAAVAGSASRMHTVAYVTDVEGHKQHWERYVSLSKVLHRAEDGRLKLRDGCGLVYGGDVVDRGSADLQVLRELLALKKDYEGRVTFILGNRDINKMRFKTELDPDYIRATVGSMPLPYWLRRDGAVTYNMFLKEEGGGDSVVNRCKYILRHSMGSPLAFEYRKEELGATATDEDVAQSYRDLVAPGGLIVQYLRQAKLIHRHEDLCFVHGAISERALAFRPQDIGKPKANPKDFAAVYLGYSLNEWMSQWNDFVNQQVREFDESAPAQEAWCVNGGYGTGIPGGDLMAVGMGWHADRSRNPTVVYNNWLKDGKPEPPPPGVAQYLARHGVNFLLTGHQPHGDLPLVIKADPRSNPDPSANPIPNPNPTPNSNPNATAFAVITADTSYSRHTRWQGASAAAASPAAGKAGPDPRDTRGVAVSEVVVKLRRSPEGSSTAVIHGVLSNGVPYEFTVDNRVGVATGDGWWVKGSGIRKMDDRLLAKSAGYDVTNKVEDAAAAG